MIQFLAQTTILLPLLVFCLTFSSKLSTRNTLIVFLLLQSAASIFLAAINLTGMFPNPIDIGFGQYFQLDKLASYMLVLVSTISLLVITYSHRFLTGDSFRQRFLRHLVLLNFSTCLLVLSNNLFILACCWCAITPILVNLTRHTESETSKHAAIKLFKYHLVSDLLLVSAVFIAFRVFGTANIATIVGTNFVQNHINQFSPFISILSLFLVFASLIKSSVFPFHSWLFSTLEAPTPFSAYLHAGLVNIAGLVSFKLFALFFSPVSFGYLLIAFGSISAVLGAVFSIAQSDVKRKLVFSTIAQMGFMCLQCGLGALPAAIFHLFFHGYFKCYAFLDAGSVIATAKATPASKRSHVGVFSGWIITFFLLYLILFPFKSLSGIIMPAIVCATAVLFDEYIYSQQKLDIHLTDLLFRTAMPLFIFLSIYGAFSYAFHLSFGQPRESELAQQSLLAFGILMIAIWIFTQLKLSNKLKDWLYVAAINGGYLTNV